MAICTVARGENCLVHGNEPSRFLHRKRQPAPSAARVRFGWRYAKGTNLIDAAPQWVERGGGKIDTTLRKVRTWDEARHPCNLMIRLDTLRYKIFLAASPRPETQRYLS